MSTDLPQVRNKQQNGCEVIKGSVHDQVVEGLQEKGGKRGGGGVRTCVNRAKVFRLETTHLLHFGRVFFCLRREGGGGGSQGENLLQTK